MAVPKTETGEQRENWRLDEALHLEQVDFELGGRHPSEDIEKVVEYTNVTAAYNLFLLMILRNNNLLYCFSSLWLFYI